MTPLTCWQKSGNKAKSCDNHYLLTFDVGAQVPGFVAFIGESDVPKGGNGKLFGDQLFAGSRVEYHGQRIGLAIATSQV